MNLKQLVVILVFSASITLASAQGLSPSDAKKLQDAINQGFQKAIREQQEKGAISSKDAEEFLKSIKAQQEKDEQRYKELQAKKSTPPVEWKEFNSKDGGFGILFPGNPTLKHMASENGLVHHSYSPQPTGEDFAVQVDYYEIPKNSDKGKLARLLDMFRDQFLKNGTLRSEKSISLNGNPGKEVLMDFPRIDASTKLQLYQTKTRLYTVYCVVQPTGAEIPPMGKKFFESLTLVEVGSLPQREQSNPSSEADPASTERKDTALSYLVAANKSSSKEIPSDLVQEVEKALTMAKGVRLEELLLELEDLKSNSSRNRKNFKRYWDAEGKALLK